MGMFWSLCRKHRLSLHRAHFYPHRTSLKRIVLTASTATIITPDAPPPATFDETCWNEASVKEVEEKGKNANPREVYRASKVLAEKGMCSFFFSFVCSVGGE